MDKRSFWGRLGRAWVKALDEDILFTVIPLIVLFFVSILFHDGQAKQGTVPLLPDISFATVVLLGIGVSRSRSPKPLATDRSEGSLGLKWLIVLYVFVVLVLGFIVLKERLFIKEEDAVAKHEKLWLFLCQITLFIASVGVLLHCHYKAVSEKQKRDDRTFAEFSTIAADSGAGAPMGPGYCEWLVNELESTREHLSRLGAELVAASTKFGQSPSLPDQHKLVSVRTEFANLLDQCDSLQTIQHHVDRLVSVAPNRGIPPAAQPTIHVKATTPPAPVGAPSPSGAA